MGLSIPRAREARIPEERLAELEKRFAHELMDTEERAELADRIHKLKKRIAEENLDTHHSCLARMED